MAKRNIKETLLSTLVHGEEVLNNIETMRKVNKDSLKEESVFSAAKRIHPCKLSLTVNEIIDTNKDAKIFRFVSLDNVLPPFQAGQYINLWVEIDGCLTSRPYSISSSPKQRGYYEITVAKTKNGFVSEYLLNRVKIGDNFVANGPSGNFVYNPVFHKTKSLFLAGGSSITPFMSMIREILLSGDERDIVLLYGSRILSTAIYHEELEDFSKKFKDFKYKLVLSEHDEKRNGDFGFLDEKIITKYVPDVLERTAYVCGPNVMHIFCKDVLLKIGLKQKDIREEVFNSSQNISQEKDYPLDFNVDQVFKIRIGDKVIDAKASEPVLVALEKSNIRVNVCCRSGECSLCKVKLLNGKVYLAKGMLLRQADEKYGYIHSCKAYPLSDLEIEI